MTSFDYEMKIDLRGEDSIPIIESETLSVPMKQNEKRGAFSLERDTSKVVLKDPIRQSRHKEEIPVPKEEARG